MAATGSHLGAELLQQAIASGQTETANRDRSVSFTNGPGHSAPATTVASPTHGKHKGSASVTFADGGMMPPMPMPQTMYNPYFPQTPSTGGTLQVPHALDAFCQYANE